MKRYLYLSIATLGISISAFGSACFSGATLADYLPGGSAGGSCTLSGPGVTYTLDDFTYLAVGVLADPSAASAITVTTSIGANGPVVQFGTNALAAGIVSDETYLFGFDIVSSTPDIEFSGVNLSETSNVTGLSSGLVAEEDCYGGLLPTPSDTLSLGNGGLGCMNGLLNVGLSVGTSVALTPGVNASADVLIPSVGPSISVDVLKEVELLAVVGSSAVSTVGQSFNTETPEPASFFLGGCGLIVLALFRPRKWRKGSDL